MYIPSDLPVKPAFSVTGVGAGSCAREKPSFHLVNRECHHFVGGGKGIFNPVAMVYVEVDIHDPLEGGLKAVDGEDDVVDVAEAGGRVPASMVPTARPVEGHTHPPTHQQVCAGQRSAR